jgi:hypothetical protein
VIAQPKRIGNSNRDSGWTGAVAAAAMFVAPGIDDDKHENEEPQD